MENITERLNGIIKAVSQFGLGLIALGIIVEIIFGTGIFWSQCGFKLVKYRRTNWRRKWIRWAYCPSNNRRITT